MLSSFLDNKEQIFISGNRNINIAKVKCWIYTEYTVGGWASIGTEPLNII